MTRRRKAPPPCHCDREGTGEIAGKGPKGEDRTVIEIHCPRHRRWVPLAAPVTPTR